MYTDKTAFHFTLQYANYEESFNQVATFRVNLQPATGESTALINGIFGRTYSLYTTYSGLQIDDIITISGTTTSSGMQYNVKAVKEYNYGPLQHFEAIVILPEG